MRNEQNWNVLGGERQGWGKDLMKCLWKCTTVDGNVSAGPGKGVGSGGELHLAVVVKSTKGTYTGWGMESCYKTLEQKEERKKEVEETYMELHTQEVPKMRWALSSMLFIHSSNNMPCMDDVPVIMALSRTNRLLIMRRLQSMSTQLKEVSNRFPQVLLSGQMVTQARDYISQLPMQLDMHIWVNCDQQDKSGSSTYSSEHLFIKGMGQTFHFPYTLSGWLEGFVMAGAGASTWDHETRYGWQSNKTEAAWVSDTVTILALSCLGADYYIRMKSTTLSKSLLLGQLFDNRWARFQIHMPRKDTLILWMADQY